MAVAHWVILFASVMIASTALGAPPLVALLALGLPLAGRRRLLLLSLALLLWLFVAQDIERRRLALLPPALTDSIVTVSGRIAGLPQCRAADFADAGIARARFDLVTAPDSVAAWPGTHRLRVVWYLPQAGCEQLAAGQHWRLQIRLKRALSGNEELSDLRAGISGRGSVLAGERLPVGVVSLSSRIDRWRQWASARLVQAAQGHTQARAILPALVSGDRRGLDARMTDTLGATGTAHLVAISGLHISLVTLLVMVLARRPVLLLARHWRPARLVLPLLALSAATLYAAMAGFAVATTRALVMAALLLVLTHSGRRLPAFSLLWLSLLLLLLADPLRAASAGLWMSVSAVYVLMLFAGRGIGVLRAQLVLCAGLSPLAAWWFMPPGLGAWLANLVMVPLFSLLVIPLALLTVLLDPLLVLIEPLGRGLSTLWPALEALARWPAVPAPASAPMALAWAGGLLLAALPGAGMPRWPLVLLLVPLCVQAWQRPAEGDFSLTVFDVGQGSAQAVLTRNEILLFDTGPNWSDGHAARRHVLPWLRRQPQRLSRVIVSHGDDDHAGGLAALQSVMPRGQVYSGEPERVPLARACRRGQRWSSAGVDFEILWPPASHGLLYSNNRSCVLKVSGRSRSLLLTGDITRPVEYALLQAGLAPTDILQVPHHGSGSSSSYPLLRALQPQVAYVTSGRSNPFGHPHPAIVSRYRSMEIAVFDTGAHGRLQWAPQTRLAHPRSSLDQQWRSPWRWVSPVVE